MAFVHGQGVRVAPGGWTLRRLALLTLAIAFHIPPDRFVEGVGDNVDTAFAGMGME